MTDPVVLADAGPIATVESRHQTLLNAMSSTGSVLPSGFDIALTPEEVLAIASPFISGCQLPITGKTISNTIFSKNFN